ncbi:MAG: hypothetical protein QW804_01400 [Candidatus Bathyarchaeia archaeon]|nr:hypothetical protein [Candidatus Bathyarchaeota archaeon]
MACRCRRIATLMLLLSLALAPMLAAAEPRGNFGLGLGGSSLENRAEAMLYVADKAKVRVEALLNSILANDTLRAMIDEADLADALEMANETFNLGVDTLELAHSSYEDGNYTGAISLALEAMGYFRDAYKELSNILCKIGVLKSEVIDGWGLLIAIQCALNRIEKMREAFERIANRTGIDISNATAKLSEAEQILNITRARELLQQGNVTEVAQMLKEANNLICEAFKELKLAIREMIANRIEQFKGKLNQIREKIRERLQNKGISEDEFYRRWNFSRAEDFWRKQMEIMESIRARFMEMGRMNATDMETISRRLREVRLELEVRLREREGVGSIEVDVEKIDGVVVRRRVTVNLRVTVRNTGNITLIFPNLAFGVIVEREINGEWRFYYSPFSAQALRVLEPGETGEVRIHLGGAEFGKYRVVVQAFRPQITGYAEFELP